MNSSDNNLSGKNKFRIPPWSYLVSILLLALFLQLAGIWRTEPIDYHPDEYVLAKPIYSIANNGQVGMKVHYKWSGCGIIYPLGYLLYILKGWLGPYTYNTILIIQRVLSAIAGTATVYIGFLLMRKLFSTTAALLAAALLAVGKLQVLLGHYGAVYTFVTLIMLLVMLLSYDIFDIKPGRKRPNLKVGRCCLLGLICGWGVAIKWTLLLSSVPIAGAFLLSVWAHRKLGIWRDFLKTNLQRILIILGMTAVSFLAALPDFMLDPNRVLSGIAFQKEQGRKGHYGSVAYESNLLSTKLLKAYKQTKACGSIYMLLPGIAAMIFCLARPSRQKLFLLWVMAVWLVILYKNLPPAQRYHLVPFILMLMLIAVALEACIENPRRWLKSAGWALCIFLIVIETLYTCITISAFWKPDARVECSKWIMANVPPGSGVTWAPRTPNWTVPGTRVAPALFKAFPRQPEQGKYQYIIAGNLKMEVFKKHPPARKVEPSEWFPKEPPSMEELLLYAEMNNGEGPNLSLVKKFYTKPSFLGLDLSLFGQPPYRDQTFANRGVTLFRFKKPY